MGLAGIHTELTAAGGGRYRFVASTETKDRFRRIVKASGWELKAFQANPVFLWAHGMSSELGEEPIGTVPAIGIDTYKRKPALIAEVAPSSELAPMAERLWAKVDAGEIKTVSIGARATVEPEVVFDDNQRVDSIIYAGQELEELSLVSVPANPDAVRMAASIFDDILDDAFAARQGPPTDRRPAGGGASSLDSAVARLAQYRLEAARRPRR